MIRGLFGQRLYPGTEAAFARHCRGVAPELTDESLRAGIRQLTGFRRGTQLWFYGEYDADPRESIARRDEMPAHRRWRRGLRSIVEDASEPAKVAFYDEVFHTNEGAALAGPSVRGLLTLVIDPERSAEYDALHADPWPDLIEALAESGFRNYSGFRRGPHVVYYGEYYPDMRSVFARMAAHEVDDRWGRAMEGIITTIRGSDGWLLTADEVAHFANTQPRSVVR